MCLLECITAYVFYSRPQHGARKDSSAGNVCLVLLIGPRAQCDVVVTHLSCDILSISFCLVSQFNCLLIMAELMFLSTAVHALRQTALQQ
jgi:hypothetical protein